MCLFLLIGAPRKMPPTVTEENHVAFTLDKYPLLMLKINALESFYFHQSYSIYERRRLDG